MFDLVHVCHLALTTHVPGTRGVSRLFSCPSFEFNDLGQATMFECPDCFYAGSLVRGALGGARSGRVRWRRRSFWWRVLLLLRCRPRSYCAGSLKDRQWYGWARTKCEGWDRCTGIRWSVDGWVRRGVGCGVRICFMGEVAMEWW